MLYNSDANEKRSTYVLEENDCNLKNQQKYETVMCLGNGYLGMRGSFSESNSAQSRLTLIAGLYDQQPNEVEELMMLPDTTLLSISADGNTVSPMSAYAFEDDLQNSSFPHARSHSRQCSLRMNLSCVNVQFSRSHILSLTLAHHASLYV